MVEDEIAHEQKFKYGWCKTDHKDGRKVLAGFRDTDYFNDEPYASQTKAMLKQLELPMPKPEEIYRGAKHDLLFLDSHGVCLRIGPTDVEDLINPGILQPLGWIETEETIKNIEGKHIPFSIVIYQGIEQYSQFFEKNIRPDSSGNLENFLEKSGQRTNDVVNHNIGFIRVIDDESQEEVAIPVLLDSDNECNSSRNRLSTKRTKVINEEDSAGINKAELMLRTIKRTFNDVKGSDLWIKAFEVHQPLRNRFAIAFRDVNNLNDEPDKERLHEFWDMCASVVNKPKNIVMHRWTTYKNDNGVNVFKRDDIQVQNMALYKPWTKELEDIRVLPAKASERLKQSWSKTKNSTELKEFNMHGRTQVMEAVYRDDIEELKQLINAGANIDNISAEIETALLIAVKREGAECIEILVKAKAKLDIQDHKGNTAFSNLAYYGHIDSFELLLNAGADLDIKNHNGETALNRALYNHRFGVADTLIKAGASIDNLTEQQSEMFASVIEESTPLREEKRREKLLQQRNKAKNKSVFVH